MKYNCHQIHFSAGIPAVSVCLGNLYAFQLWQFIHRRAELSSIAELSIIHIHTHIHIRASTHLSQGHVVMIPPCEWVRHAAGVLCVDVWMREMVLLGLQWTDNFFSPDISSVQLFDDLLLDFFKSDFTFTDLLLLTACGQGEDWVYFSHLLLLKGE